MKTCRSSGLSSSNSNSSLAGAARALGLSCSKSAGKGRPIPESPIFTKANSGFRVRS